MNDSSIDMDDSSMDEDDRMSEVSEADQRKRRLAILRKSRQRSSNTKSDRERT